MLRENLQYLLNKKRSTKIIEEKDTLEEEVMEVVDLVLAHGSHSPVIDAEKKVIRHMIAPNMM